MVKYITIKKGKYYIKNDFDAFKLFYNYFLFRPKIRNKIFKKIFFLINIFVLFIIRLIFSFKINYILPTINNNQNFLVRREGKGNYKNVVTLYKEGEKFVIDKKVYNSDSLEREVKFLKLYYTNTAGITIPKYSIDFHSKIIKYEFLMQPCLATEIRIGKFNRHEALNLYAKICDNLKNMYGNEKAYTHGDLSPDNIYLINGNIYLIDFTDAEYLPIYYDFLFLLYRILQEYDRLDIEDLFEYINTNRNLKSILSDILECDIDDQTKNEFFNNYKRKLEYKHNNHCIKQI